MILAILKLCQCVTVMPPIKFWLNPTYSLGGDIFWRISRWPQNRTNLAILNLCVPVMPPIKFQLNPIYSLGEDVDWRISRWPPWYPTWISEKNDFSNSEFLCHWLLPTKFWLNLTFCLGGDVIWRISRWHPWWPFWLSERNNFSISESLCTPMVAIKLWFNPTYGLGGDVVWEFQDGCHSGHFGYRNGTILAILKSLCHCDASHQVLAQSDLRFGRRCLLKNFKMASMAAILDIRTKIF